MAVLVADQLFRFFTADHAQVPVLKGIDLRLDEGEFVTIMGPSGSGKSTLLHILSGMDLPSAGDVLLNGRSIVKAGERERTRMRREQIGFIFQFFNLLPDLSVRENVELPLMIGGERPARHRARIDELLGLLQIDGLADRSPGKLSGGEMQRVSIARALAGEPPLLFADEPTGNLSSKAGEEIIHLLRDVTAQLGTAVLLVTHNPRDAAAGDRVLFLRDGAMPGESALTGGSFDAADVFHRLEELGI